MRRVLAMAAHRALEECQLVMNHFNNRKSVIEIAEIIKRSNSSPQHIIERYKKENRLTSKLRKSAKKSFTA